MPVARAASGSCNPMRPWRRAKLVWAPSNATISPSSTVSAGARAARASTISGYVPSIRFSLRDQSAAPRRSCTAIARTPSSLRSKIQAGSVKRSWVSVASIGAMNPAVVMPRSIGTP